MKDFKPMLLSDLRHYNASQFLRDVIAGIIVAIIALPLSIALAIASGVGPEAGIYTAIIAGFRKANVRRIDVDGNVVKIFGNRVRIRFQWVAELCKVKSSNCKPYNGAKETADEQ